MSVPQIVLLFVITVPLLLTVLNRLRADVAALLMAALLGILQFAGLPVFSESAGASEAIKAIEGFSQPTVITLIGLFIITGALEKTGFTRWVAQRIMLLGGSSESALITLFAAAAALFSLVMNNLAAGALLLPSAMEAAKRTGVRPSKLLIPVSFGSMLGGAATYFTTANIITSDLLRLAQPAYQPLTMLDFLQTGGLIALAGILYLAVLGRHLLPDRIPHAAQMIAAITGSQMEEAFAVQERLWSVRINPNSPLTGQMLSEAGFGMRLGITTVAVQRRGRELFVPSPGYQMDAGDHLLVIGREDRVRQLEPLELEVAPNALRTSLTARGINLLEVVLSPHNTVEGRTLSEIQFRKKYGFSVAAIKRRDRNYRTDVGKLPLQMGDSLLVVGPASQRAHLRASADFLVIEPDPYDQPVEKKSALFLILLVLAIVIASIFLVPTYLAVLAGLVLLMLSGIVSIEQAYRLVEWQAIFLVAGMYAVSQAMVATGLAGLVGRGLIVVATPLGPLGLAAGGYLLSGLLTQLMGGQVAALITAPITITAAIQAGVNPQAVALATAIGCSTAFLTPLAHPVNILMIAPGGYRFGDFFRVGGLLTLLSFTVLMLGLKIFWGL